MKIEVAVLMAIEEPAVMHRPLPFAVDLFDREVAGVRLQRFELLYRLCIVVLARLLQCPCVAGALASLRIDILAHPDIGVEQIGSFAGDGKTNYRTPAMAEQEYL